MSTENKKKYKGENEADCASCSPALRADQGIWTVNLVGSWGAKPVWMNLERKGVEQIWGLMEAAYLRSKRRLANRTKPELPKAVWWLCQDPKQQDNKHFILDCELWRNGEGGYHKWLLDSQANSEEREGKGGERGKRDYQDDPTNQKWETLMLRMIYKKINHEKWNDPRWNKNSLKMYKVTLK